jgi:hypothetical protein
MEENVNQTGATEVVATDFSGNVEVTPLEAPVEQE